MTNVDTHPHLRELLELAQEFPRLPGVYLMKDRDQEVIYVGKAKDLRARVTTYFQGGDGRIQISYLLERIRSLEKIVCESEEQAFILERDLIQRYKPRYNVKLKDDKGYLHIRLDERSAWPRLELTRRPQQDGATYFGPFTWSYELREVLEVIRNVVPLRTCSDTVFSNRQRPCLEYQIKRCAGPCCLPVDELQYRGWVKDAKAILIGKVGEIIDALRQRMEEASEALRFEEAAAHRDRIAILERFASGQRSVLRLGESRDAVSIYREGDKVSVAILHVRDGRIAQASNFALNDVYCSDEECLESVVHQFYGNGGEIPDEVLLPVELESMSALEHILHQRLKQRVHLVVPERGVKARLVGLAAVNAKHNFVTQFKAEDRYSEAARHLADLLGLNQVPRRIECVDISHFQGDDIVAAIVVFFDGQPLKRDYKRYRISRQGKSDDFASIAEVVGRRLARGKETGEFPDLLLIDGGMGQLNAALGARDELGLILDVASIAKISTNSEGEEQPERLFREGTNEPVPLDPRWEVTQLVTRIRDEVHRFVITFHRESRSKTSMQSIMDNVVGIGPERRSRLLRHYGSINAIGRAAPEEIAKVGRMPLGLAQKLLRHLGAAKS